MDLERNIYAMDCDGYMIPCTLLIKVLPSLSEGVQIVGFVKEKENAGEAEKSGDNFILYGEDTGMIYGVTRSCVENFSIKSALTHGRCPNMSELTLEMICPEILDPQNQDDYKSNSGVTVNLDTTVILQNYPFDNDDNDDLEEEKLMLEQTEICTENDGTFKKKKYRRCQIRAFLHQVTNLPDWNVKVKCMRFTENLGDFNSGDGLTEEANVASAKDLSDQESGNMNASLVGSIDDGMSEMSIKSDGSVNDEMKHLKECKAAISEKKVPKEIKRLNIIFHLFGLFVLAILITDLAFYVNLNNDAGSASKAIDITYHRTSLLAEDNFYIRKLNLIGKSLFFQPKSKFMDRAY